MGNIGNEVKRGALLREPPPQIGHAIESTRNLGAPRSRLNKPVRAGSRLLLPIFAGALSPAARLLGALMLSCISLLFTFETVRAGDAVFQPGDAVVTGFSGIAPAEREPAANANPADEFFINQDGASARIFALTPDGPPQGQEIKRTVRFEVKAGDVGQVFGVALDDAATPNIYLGASSAFGLQIVLPGSGDGGQPVRTKLGDPQADWMPGQFGTEKGGGPGSIWKVDGVSGAVSLFANIPDNSGPGLGNIAFDKAHQQFFVSDLDTGLIYRIGRDGQVLDAFDHGVAGHTAAGLPPVPDDGSQMNIKDPGFDSENPETWGLTSAERRIWGVAVHDSRLYYAVWAGPQVWSVGLNPDGSIGADARKEFDVEGGEAASPVSDIVIDSRGTVYVAQRGGITPSYDYSVFAQAKASSVLRYRKDPSSGQWAREEYAIGLPADFLNASGGVDLGNCEKMVWSAGDALRNVPEQAEKLKDRGQLVIHGLQGNAVDLVRPANEPPMQAYFLDYDGQYEDAQAEGQVGGIRIYRTACESTASEVAPPPYVEENEYVEFPGCIPGERGCAIPHCPPDRPHCCPPRTYWNGHVCCRYGTRCCPPGTRWNGHVCCRRGQHCCPPGSHWNGRVCCPRGQHCCPPGSHWNGRVCCPRGRHCCPPGNHWNPDSRDCTPILRTPCLERQAFVGGRCVQLHLRRASRLRDDRPTHSKRESRRKDDTPSHSRRESRHKDHPSHSRRESRHNDHPSHSRRESRHNNDGHKHSRRASRIQKLHHDAKPDHHRGRRPGFINRNREHGGRRFNRPMQRFHMLRR